MVLGIFRLGNLEVIVEDFIDLLRDLRTIWRPNNFRLSHYWANWLFEETFDQVRQVRHSFFVLFLDGCKECRVTLLGVQNLLYLDHGLPFGQSHFDLWFLEHDVLVDVALALGPGLFDVVLGKLAVVAEADDLFFVFQRDVDFVDEFF